MLGTLFDGLKLPKGIETALLLHQTRTRKTFQTDDVVYNNKIVAIYSPLRSECSGEATGGGGFMGGGGVNTPHFFENMVI